LLRDEALLSADRIELLLSWQNTGFSVHDSVTVEPGADARPAAQVAHGAASEEWAHRVLTVLAGKAASLVPSASRRQRSFDA
jgi:hypothetical protein